MNTFLIDKEYGEEYERFISRAFHGIWNNTTKDDEGIDIILDNWKIDVKAYAKPRRIKEFKGFFIEVMIETEKKHEYHAGWYLNPKKTTHFCFIKDCCKDCVAFDKLYLITPCDLCKAVTDAMKDGEIKDFTKYGNVTGYILPYKYVLKYSILMADYETIKEMAEQ